jgi:hypothetical protein
MHRSHIGARASAPTSRAGRALVAFGSSGVCETGAASDQTIDAQQRKADMIMDSVRQLEDDTLDVIERVEAPLLAGAASAAEAFADYVPSRPLLPFVNAFPTLAELVDTGAEFWTRVATQQANFARQLVHAFDPVLNRIDDRSTTSRTAPARTTEASETKAA